jgi:hypothetical protein
LRDALRTGRRAREWIEVRLLVELRGEQRAGDAPSLRRAGDRRGVALRTKDWSVRAPSPSPSPVAPAPGNPTDAVPAFNENP